MQTSVNAVRYSALCEVDKTAYLAYCAATICNGAGLIQHRSGLVGVSGESDCGGGDTGSSAVPQYRVTFGSGPEDSVVVDSFGVVSGGHGHGGFRLGVTGRGCEISDSGITSLCAGDDGRGVVGITGVLPVGRVTDDSAGSEGRRFSEVLLENKKKEEAVAVSEKTLENRKKRHAARDRKRARKEAGLARGDKVPEWRVKSEDTSVRPNLRFGGGGFFSALDESDRKDLRESRAQMLKAKNLLEAAKARRQLEKVEKGELSPVQQARELRAQQQLEVMKAKDLELEKKRVNTRMLRDAECDKVKIEQSFAKLTASGNVPHIGGSVKTVISGATGSLSSGTISPNSSISMKEIHDMMEKLAFLEKSHEEHQEFARHVKTLHPLIYDTLAPKEREVGKSFPPETEYEPTEGGGYPEHAWELEENLGMFDLEPDNKFRRRPDPDDTSGLIEYHKRRFHQFGIPVPYKSELSFIADNHLGR